MKIQTLLFVLIFIQATFCQETHQKLDLDTPYQKQLNKDSVPPFMGRYIFNIDEQKVNNLRSQKWFFFVELEPNEDQQWIQTQIELSVGKKDSEQSTKVKSCDARQGGVDSCFLTNKQFNFQKQQVHVRIRCKGSCKFKLSGEISAPYKVEPGSTVKMDFQNTAYSKIFTLDTRKRQNFDQLRIVLRPEGFLQFPAPIGLYVNQDESVPTKNKHDLKGMTLWDNGQGVFLDLPDAKGIFTILIEGPEKNVLLLETQLVSFTQTNELKQNLPFFDYLGAESSKKYKVKVNPLKGICFQLTTFSGAIKLTNIYDQKLVLIDEEFSPLFRTYSEIQYQLDAEFFKKNKDDFKLDEYIIFEVEGVKESTFVVEPYELNPSISHLIHQRTRYVELPSKKYHQYYIEMVELNSPQFKREEFEIILTAQQSNPFKTRFFNCKKEHGRQCELKNSQITQKTLNNQDITQVSNFSTEHLMSGVEIYKFNIPASKFVKSGNETKKYILTILIQNNEKQQHYYTIQYLNTGKNIYLKEGEVKKDRVGLDEIKYYVFTNTNAEVEEIRIHVMEISGRVFMEGYLQDPRKSDLSGQEIIDYHNSVRYEKVKENQTIYLKIQGKENAFYSVQLQLMKQSERQWWNRTHPNNGKGYNEIILVEDIAYEFNIKAKSKEVYQLHSKETKFNLDISSLLPLELCMTEQLKKAPFPPNCQEIDTLTKNKIYDVTLEKGKIGNIGVTNNNEKDVKFNIRFTSPNSVKPITDNSTQVDIKCLPGVLGKINKFNFKKDTSSCYSYFLEKNDDLEVIVDIISDQYDKVNVMAQINKVERVEIIGTTHLFRKSQLQKACGNISPCPLKIFIDSKINTEIRFTTQYLSGTFYLLDGIANQFTGTKEPRNFAYQLYNKVNTTIIMENRNGYFKFYGKVVEANNYWNGKQTFPTQKDKIVQSTNPFYYQYQISILTQALIQSAKCTECILLLTVVREENSFNPNEKSRFIIECTQEQRFLKENQPIVSFLGRRSIAFYEFYNSQNGSVLVSINTQNQECIQTYIKHGSTRASGSDYDKRSQSPNTNRIIIDNAVLGDYSITLQATEDCYYSIDVTTSANETLGTIEQGIYKDISLDKNQTTKFVYENKKDEAIKILTLHQSGQITINVKSYPDIKALMGDNLKKPKYQWSGKDFLKIKKTDKDYCSNCVYLIVATAERQTKTSIMIPSASADSEFPIVMDSFIKDQLQKDEIETLRIFTQTITQFQVNVQYGQVKIDIYSSSNDKVVFTKNFKESQATQYQNITYTDDYSQKIDYTFMRYIKVKITAIKNSGFSFGFISNKEESKRGNKIKYGVPQYVTLAAKKRECLRGTLDDDKQQFLISITGEKQLDLMNNLEISCQVSKAMLELNKNIAKNQMIVTYNKAPKVLPAEYEFCMTSNQDVFLTFIQSSKLNYFPESQIIMVSKEMNLSFYAEGKSLIEINQCTSRAMTTISQSFNNMGGVNSDVKQVRKTNSIIQFNFYGPVYINVKADSATLSWRKKDELTKQGFGYDEYTSNRIRIDKTGDILTVEVFPLKKIVEKSKVTMKNVEFTAFIAEEEMNLYDAMNCNNGKYLSKSISSNTEEKTIIISFQIDKILKQFKNKKYVLVGILATASSNIAGDQKYRFIYPYQQILIAGLTSNLENEEEINIGPNPPKPNEQTQTSWFNTFVIYFTLAVVFIFFVIWVYRKWIKKLLKRHKRQQLSEQGTGEVRYQEFTSYT